MLVTQRGILASVLFSLQWLQTQEDCSWQQPNSNFSPAFYHLPYVSWNTSPLIFHISPVNWSKGFGRISFLFPAMNIWIKQNNKSQHKLFEIIGSLLPSYNLTISLDNIYVMATCVILMLPNVNVNPFEFVHPIDPECRVGCVQRGRFPSSIYFD